MTYTVPLFRCTRCDHADRAVDASNFDDDPYVGMLCPVCGNESVEYVRSRPARFVSVAVYDVDRAYGGPEEGGWYYDCGTRIDETLRCFEAGDLPQIRAYVETLKTRYPDPSGQIDGRLYVNAYTEEVAPKHFPTSRPVYS